MRFLLDQNADRRFLPYLRSLGHDVTGTGIDYPSRLADHAIIALAARERRTIITNDTDFGELAIRQGMPHAGIIRFRVGAADFATRQACLAVVLTEHADRLDQLIVVTLDSVRVRRRR
jgi:predicted nuclease of predicted toxin-antitoxin system